MIWPHLAAGPTCHTQVTIGNNDAVSLRPGSTVTVPGDENLEAKTPGDGGRVKVEAKGDLILSAIGYVIKTMCCA
jgi:hypothetical protein